MSETTEAYFWAIITSTVTKQTLAYLGSFTSVKVAQAAAETLFPGRVLMTFVESELMEKMNELLTESR